MSRRSEKKFVDPNIAEFVKLVADAGWSQAETARNLFITPGAVSQICSGKTRPRKSLLALLRCLTGGQAKENQGTDGPGAGPRTPWERELLACVCKLSNSQRQLVMRLAHELRAAA